MPRKDIVKVVLSREQHEVLKRLAQRFGISESEALRTALMDYAKSLSVLTEYAHNNKNSTFFS